MTDNRNSKPALLRLLHAHPRRFHGSRSSSRVGESHLLPSLALPRQTTRSLRLRRHSHQHHLPSFLLPAFTVLLIFLSRHRCSHPRLPPIPTRSRHEHNINNHRRSTFTTHRLRPGLFLPPVLSLPAVPPLIPTRPRAAAVYLPLLAHTHTHTTTILLLLPRILPLSQSVTTTCPPPPPLTPTLTTTTTTATHTHTPTLTTHMTVKVNVCQPNAVDVRP